MSRRASGDPAFDPFADLLLDDGWVRNLTVALNYDCNSACTFCFIAPEIRQRYAPTTDGFLERVFEENARRGLFDRIIFSGAECTLRRDLPDIVRRARAEGGFSAVQIQTNGRRLSDGAYLDTLLDAGVDEYFVSVQGGDPGVEAALTGSAASFGEMRQGLRNLRARGAAFVTNTVISAGSAPHLPGTARFLVDEGVPESHFWGFIEFGDIGQEAEHLDYGAAAAPLREALDLLRGAGRRLEVSWFPVCLLGRHADLVRNHRSNTLIHEAFTARIAGSARFSCPRGAECAELGRSCVGLHERALAVHGAPSALTPFAEPLSEEPRGDALMDGWAQPQ